MIKKYIPSIIIVFILSNFVYTQTIPNDFHLNDSKNLSKSLSSATPLSNSISDIFTIGDTILLGTSRGLSISTNNGDTWENYYQKNDFAEDGVSTVSYNKFTNTIWVATARSFNEDVDMGTGLHYSTDLGNTWTNLPQPVDASGDSMIAYGINDGANLPLIYALPVTVPQQNITYDIAFTPGTIWIASWSSGLRKSTDKGQTWQRVLLPSDYLNSISSTDTVKFQLRPKTGSKGNLNHEGFSIITTNDSTLYVGTANGINKTTNAYAEYPSWKKFNHQNQNNPISGNFVVALGYNQYNNTVWGATWVAEDNQEYYGVSYTSDGGQKWQTTLDGEKVHNFGFKFNDVISPSDNGAFRSSNIGVSWILPNSIVDSKSTNRIDNGVAFYAAASNNNFVWIGSDNGLARLDETPNIIWTGEWKVYFASQGLASLKETHAFPNPFSPRQEKLSIKYSTGGKSAKVTIRVFNFSMNYVATIIQNADRSETGEGTGIIDYWDGRDGSGSIVPNGVYFYRVEVGSDEPVYGKILVLQ